MKDIPGFEGLYAATEDGQIWSYPRKWLSGNDFNSKHSGKFLRPFRQSRGYLKVTLTVNGQYFQRYIHRLVALAFLANPLHLAEVNHLDGDKHNNHHSNLEWASHRDNTAYYYKTHYRPKRTSAI